MKRRFWVGLAVIPLLLLLGTTLYARKTAWERQEKDFRKQILADATRSPNSSFVISVTMVSGTRDLATLTPVQLKSLLADVHLQRAAPRTSYDDRPASIGLRFATFAGKSNPVSGFYIGAKEGGGSIGVGGTSWGFDNKWRGFEFTPASVQVIRRRMWAQYGVTLRALDILQSKQLGQIR